MMIISTAMSVASSVMSGTQAQKQGEYEAGVARYNARVQENAATRERNAAIEAERDRKLQTRALAAKQQAALAAKGVDIGSGSSLDLVSDTEMYGNIDAFRIRQNADARAEALQQQAALDRAQGRAVAARGRNAMFSSLLTAGAKVAGAWYKMKSPVGDDDERMWA